MAPAAVVLWRDFISQLQHLSTAAHINANNRTSGKLQQALERIEQLPAASNAEWEALVIKKKVC
jgi:hypothetical protein